jgi:carbon-monoxide dehydrogenase large subunit
MNAPEPAVSTTLPPVTEDPRYIGASVSRPGAQRLVEGRGTYVDDIQLPRMAHVVFWRSPVAHCRILRIEPSFARLMPGVLAVVDGAQMARICQPWVATLSHLSGMKSAPQYPLAWWLKPGPRPRTHCNTCRWNGKPCRR